VNEVYDKETEKNNSSSGPVGRAFVFTIEPGKDLLLALKKMLEEEGIQSGLVISAVGSLKKALLRNMKRFPGQLPVTDEDRLYKTFEGPLEILSLSGNVSCQDEELVLHGHITVSCIQDGRVEVLGGHLVEGCITYVKVEVAVLEVKVDMIRVWNPERKTWELGFK
jgi:predicted DNA-binding protein with PD1-like motif